MKVLVCGGRSFADRGRVFTKLDLIKPSISAIIHGSCMITGKLSGADQFAEEWAQFREIPYIGVPAKWTKYKKSAGPMRNHQMVDEFYPDLCVCFPGGRGTGDMVARCRAVGIPVVEG